MKLPRFHRHPDKRDNREVGLVRVITDIISNPRGVAQLSSAPNIGIVGGRVEFFFENAQNPRASKRPTRSKTRHNVKRFAVAAYFTL